jgi:rRNA-processing protein Efg1
MFVKELPNEVREAQQKKLEELKKQLEIHNTLVVEREIQLRDRKIKFFGTYLFPLFSVTGVQLHVENAKG